MIMEFRQLGRSGLRVPVLSFGAGTFGGRGPLFSGWGSTQVAEARELISIAIDAGAIMIDTADVYSDGASEEIVGAAIRGRRDQVLISTKAGLPTGPGEGEAGTSRPRLVGAVEAALRRLGTDHLDLFQVHGFDAGTPVEEVMSTLQQLVQEGKVRYVGASNFAGWQLVKSLHASDDHGWPRYVAHQVYYSLVGRDYEAELMPLGLDQEVGALVWSPLAWGRLTGRIRRDQPLPERSRLHTTADYGPPVEDALLYAVVDVLLEIAAETGRSVPQLALNWLINRPTVASVIIGARDADQLRHNLGATGWSLDPEHVARLDAVSYRLPPYPHFPYHRQAGFARLAPPLFPGPESPA
ncbi:aldo/keto reductase [Microlunatus sp. GCM10028923]|uniref:aldo/keto reductase n=1 Tax=Microlunatus sp. GCM10028923 TaxID=3273400 RepID=UPI00366D50A2